MWARVGARSPPRKYSEEDPRHRAGAAAAPCLTTRQEATLGLRTESRMTHGPGEQACGTRCRPAEHDVVVRSQLPGEAAVAGGRRPGSPDLAARPLGVPARLPVRLRPGRRRAAVHRATAPHRSPGRGRHPRLHGAITGAKRCHDQAPLRRRRHRLRRVARRSPRHRERARPGRAGFPELGLTLELARDEVYMFGSFTAPELRGKNVATARSSAMLIGLREMGYRRAVAYVVPEDRDSAWSCTEDRLSPCGMDRVRRDTPAPHRVRQGAWGAATDPVGEAGDCDQARRPEPSGCGFQGRARRRWSLPVAVDGASRRLPLIG